MGSPKVQINGSLALVTGAGSGIGAATARLLATRGATVLVADLNGPAAESTVAAITAAGGSAFAYNVDVSDAAAMDRLAETVGADHRAPDIVVNNAGIGMSGRLRDMSPGDWDTIIGINLLGVANGCRSFMPAMLARRSGHIVNISSGLGYIATPDVIGYCTAKAGVLHLSRCLRADAAPSGVGVSVICPGVINTPIVSSMVALGPSGSPKGRKAIEANFRKGHPPEQVAAAIVQAIEKNRSVVPVGGEAWAGWYASRFLPTPAFDWVTRVGGKLMERGQH